MAVTTVLNDEGSTTVVSSSNDSDGLSESRFSWSPTIAGGLVATAIAILLLTFGSSIGLAPVAVHHASTPSAVTTGAIYTFAALAFAFAIGGYITGRLIEPARPEARDERFRSAAHGLVAWAFAAVGVAVLIVASGPASGPAVTNSTPPQTLTNDYVGYWVDMLFRPAPGSSQSWLGGTQFAQADTGNTTDATPQPQTPNPAAVPSPDFPETSGPFANQPPSKPQQAPTPAHSAPQAPPVSVPRNTTSDTIAPEDVKISQQQNGSATPLGLGADKAEAARIIKIGMADGAHLSQYDEDRIVALIAQDTNLARSDAQRRVDNAETRIRDDMANAERIVRTTRNDADLWITISLLFGAVAASLAAMSARRRAETPTFGWPRQEPQ